MNNIGERLVGSGRREEEEAEEEEEEEGRMEGARVETTPWLVGSFDLLPP